MDIHKATTFKHNCITKPKPNFGSETMFKSKNQRTEKMTKLDNTSQLFDENSVFSILEAVDGDLLKASQILDNKLEATNKLIQELMESSKSLSDEEFYKRLSDLKNDHKNTLTMCENLYTMTHRDNGEISNNTFYKKLGQTVTFRDDGEDPRRSSDLVRDSIRELEKEVYLDAAEHASPFMDMSNSFSKPPIPKHTRPSRTVEAWSNNRHPADRDGQVWVPPESETSSIGEDNDENQIKEHYRELLRTKVKAMWKDFNTGDGPDQQYNAIERTNGHKRARSGSLDRSWSKIDRTIASDLRQSGPLAATENWRHRITIPQPFTMTLKEEAKANKKSRSQIIFEQEQLEREMAEEAECLVKFKANPVPANVYIPLFDEICEKQNAKREFIKQYSKEMLKSQEKPFSFVEREKEKKMNQKERISEADKVKNYQRSTHGDRQQLAIKAKPVPSSTFSNRSQKLKEDELLRQIKIKMRSEDMLRKSAEPQGMAERQKLQEQKRQAKLKSSVNKARASSADGRPRARDPPNFSELHRAFDLERLHKQADVKVTYPEPFKLRTEERGEINQKKFKESTDKRKDPKTTKTVYDYSSSYPSNRDSDWNRSLIQHDDVPPARLTRKDFMLQSARQEARQNEGKTKAESKMLERKREQRRRELAESLRNSAEFNAQRGPSINALRKSKIEDQRRLEEEYRQKMLDLEKKMKERDLLIVQQQKLMARQKAEAQYRKTLTNAGVDPSEVDDRSRDCRDADILAYTTSHGFGDSELMSVTSTMASDDQKDTRLDETRFGAPSPILE